MCFYEPTRLTWRMYLPPTLCHTNMNCRGYDPGLTPVLWELRIRGCAGLSPGYNPYTHLPDTESIASATMKKQHPTHKIDTLHRLRGCISTHAWQRHSSRGCAALQVVLGCKTCERVGAHTPQDRSKPSTIVPVIPTGYQVVTQHRIDWPWQIIHRHVSV